MPRVREAIEKIKRGGANLSQVEIRKLASAGNLNQGELAQIKKLNRIRRGKSLLAKIARAGGDIGNLTRREVENAKKRLPKFR